LQLNQLRHPQTVMERQANHQIPLIRPLSLALHGGVAHVGDAPNRSVGVLRKE
jgi:hypothetical protein